MKGILSCRRKRRRVGQVGQVCQAMRAVTNVSWPIPSHLCSRPPARSGSTLSITSVVVDIEIVAIVTTRRTALLL